MQGKRKNISSGRTLVETVIAILIIAIAALGALRVRYYAALDARKADVQMTASRLALSLLETWEGGTEPNSYDPATEFDPEITIFLDSGPDGPEGFQTLESYQIVENRTNYFVTLSYKGETANEPRVLNATIAWPLPGSDTWESGKSFLLTTYMYED